MEEIAIRIVSFFFFFFQAKFQLQRKLIKQNWVLKGIVYIKSTVLFPPRSVKKSSNAFQIEIPVFVYRSTKLKIPIQNCQNSKLDQF